MKGINHVEYWTCSCGANCSNGFKKCPVCGKARFEPVTAKCQNTVAERTKLVPLDKAKPVAQAIFPNTAKLRIVITRGYRGRPLDHDNLVGGCKALRDEISRVLLGRDDAESELLEWEYHQDKGGINKIEIYEENK